VQLRDIDTETSNTVFRGHTEDVSSVAYSPDGKTLVSASSDKTVRVWMRQSGPPSRSFTTTKAVPLGGVFSPDGKSLAVVNDNQPIVWDIPSSIAHRHSSRW
jgi:WD40 repeat protein